MVENFKWLLTSEEIEFEKKKFRGKLAGKAYKYSQNIDGLIRTRIIIFAMSILVFYRVLANYLFYDVFDMQFLIERLVFSLVILTGGLLFNKVRVIAIFLAVIPLIIIVFTYFILPEQFSLRIIGFMIAIIIIILSGIYHNIQLKKIKKDLQNTLIEN
jgi:hypothetical protein